MGNVGEKHKLGLFSALVIMVGSLIGSSIYILMGQLVERAGGATYLAFIIGATPAFFASIYYVQLNAMFPSLGGSYFFGKRLLNPLSGLLSAMFLAFGGIGAIGMLATGFGQYFHFYFPSWNPLIIAIGVIILFAGINYFGIQAAKLFQLFMVVWILLALFIFIIGGLLYKGEAVTEINNVFLPNGIGGLIMASVLAFFSYAAFSIVTEIGGQIKNPQRNVPLTIVLSLSIVTIIFVGVSYVSTSVVGSEQIINSYAPIPDIAKIYLPNWVSVMIGISGLFAIATTLNAITIVMPQELYVLAKEKMFPKIFAKKHVTFGSPVVAMLSMVAVSILLVISGFSSDVFTTMTVVGVLSSGAMTGFAATKIFKRAHEDYEKATVRIPKPILLLFCWVGMIFCIGFSIIALLQTKLVALLLAIYVAIILIFNMFRKGGEDLIEENKQLPV